MAVMDRAATSFFYASFGVRSHHLTPFATQWNVRKSLLLRLPLIGNYRRLRHRWCDKCGHGERKGTSLGLLTNPASACSITMVGFEFGNTVFYRSIANRKRVVHACAQRLAWDTPPDAAPDQLWQYLEAAWRLLKPEGYIQSLSDSMPRRVAAVIVNNGGYTNY
ncbi:hypothetical protein TNCV_871901 [Trichonephila clavipes]|nr:hypothetical protein TNCV_871901 [Trichonephila clavipes]